MKKQIFSTLVLSIGILLPFSLHSQEQRKKVGVVLSGGGAKGMAHIKALKVIEEAGIPIDYIAGTSMGAIVGGLYAIGYTTEQLDSMVRKQDWTFLLSDRIKRSAMSLTDRERSEKYTVSIPFTKTPKDAATGGLMKGQNLANLFSDLTVGSTFFSWLDWQVMSTICPRISGTLLSLSAFFKAFCTSTPIIISAPMAFTTSAG